MLDDRKADEEYIRVRIIYDSADKLRNISIHDLDNEPLSYTFRFNNLEANEDGMYRFSDFEKHLISKISAYDELKKKYDPDESSLPNTGIE